MEETSNHKSVEEIVINQSSERDVRKANTGFLKDRLHSERLFLWPDILNSYGRSSDGKVTQVIKTEGVGRGFLGSPVAIINRDAFGDYFSVEVLRKKVLRYHQVIKNAFEKYTKKSGKKVPINLHYF